METPNASPNIVGAQCAIRFGLRGLILCLANGFATGLEAVALAARAIALGRADAFLVVGSETLHGAAERLLDAGAAARSPASSAARAPQRLSSRPQTLPPPAARRSVRVSPAGVWHRPATAGTAKPRGSPRRYDWLSSAQSVCRRTSTCSSPLSAAAA